ncbi:MAG: BMP family ABC transporter substrate-binding protein [Halobacteriales archaeon]
MTTNDTDTTRRKVLKSIGAAGVAGLAGCAGDSGEGTPTATATDASGSGEGMSTATATDAGGDTVKAAWLYVSEVGDLGWSWAHDQGRKAAEERFDWLETEFSEAIFPPDAKAEMQRYTNQGFDVIFGTTFGYMNDMVDLSKENPDTIYEHCSGFKTTDNLGRYFGRMDQARYLAGVAAGMVTEANVLGYVAAKPISEVIRGINAFTLGAASVNPEVTTKVRWTNTWYDPTKETEAAQALLDEGVDVMAQHQDSPSALEAAAEDGIWATGYDAPMAEFAGDNYLTSPIWHWEVFYEPTLKAVHDGTWESDFYYEGLDAGIVDLDDWGPEVPSDVKDEVSSTRSAIVGGDLDIWADSTFADWSVSERFQNMGSYVEAVEGSVPSS